MGALVIEFGGGKPAAKKNGIADAAFSDFMKEKGKGGDAPADEEQSAANGAGEEAAQEFLDAVKAGKPADVYAAFCHMAEAHAHGDEGGDGEESDSEDDYED